jgi:23S rRNA (guanosine2251-2'-O)-methyltransferase
MFRTADAFGVEKIFLTGYTPAPLDRFKRPVSKIAKTALGAELTIPWQSSDDVTTVIELLKSKGVRVVALEQDARAVNVNAYTAPARWALIVGNEVEGVDAETLGLADDVIEIKMHGKKESLNVAVAAGIALYTLVQK